MHFWVQLFSGMLLYIVLWALHVFVYLPPPFYGLFCPERTLNANHCIPTLTLLFSSEFAGEDGGWPSCFLTTIQRFMVPPYTSHSCFILEHLGSTSQFVTFMKGIVLWRCNSRLFNYEFSLNNVAFKLND